MFAELVLKSRSYRRFYEDEPVNHETLRELVALTRHCPSGANLQPLKFMISSDPEKNETIFEQLAWAGYLKDWVGPPPGERPTAYIIVLCDTAIANTPGCDHGIAAQTIMLGAVEKGLGGCIIASIKKNALRQKLSISDGLEILLVLALGKPKETVVIDSVGPEGNIRYWRDDHQVHHVPKRSLETLIVE